MLVVDVTAIAPKSCRFRNKQYTVHTSCIVRRVGMRSRRLEFDFKRTRRVDECMKKILPKRWQLREKTRSMWGQEGKREKKIMATAASYQLSIFVFTHSTYVSRRYTACDKSDCWNKCRRRQRGGDLQDREDRNNREHGIRGVGKKKIKQNDLKMSDKYSEITAAAATTKTKQRYIITTTWWRCRSYLCQKLNYIRQYVTAATRSRMAL